MKVKKLREYIPMTTNVDIVDSETKLIKVLMTNIWAEIKPYANYDVEQIYPRDKYTLIIEVKKAKK